MGRYSPEGVFYLHLIIISFGLIIFTILKNFNFNDYLNSPDLTRTQIDFIFLLLFIGFIGMILILVRGYTVKTPQVYTRAGVAVVSMMIGFVIVIAMFFHDELLGNSRVLGPYEMLGMIFGSFLSIMGVLVYISIKFPDDTRMKYFKQAVREEIRNRGKQEEQMRAWNMQQRRLKRQAKVITKSKSKKRSKKPKVKVAEVEMAPVDELTIVKCAKCARSLKLSSPERPVTIKCPYCEAIGVIKE